ncbi:Uncharacterised protein [Mycobacteroides abscessus subsp. abscessus]|nr:Uncharacterised protein [Mycobacteroides abscessus subsp. abscessus]
MSTGTSLPVAGFELRRPARSLISTSLGSGPAEIAPQAACTVG